MHLYHKTHHNLTKEIKIENENKTFVKIFLKLNTKSMWMNLQFLHFIVYVIGHKLFTSVATRDLPSLLAVDFYFEVFPHFINY